MDVAEPVRTADDWEYTVGMQPDGIADAVRALIACDDGRPLGRYRLARRYLAMSAIRLAIRLDERVFDALVAYFDWQLRRRTEQAPHDLSYRRIRVYGSDGGVTCSGSGGHHGHL
jgi:hypothetical protein